jgi:hypothetical protein
VDILTDYYGSDHAPVYLELSQSKIWNIIYKYYLK